MYGIKPRFQTFSSIVIWLSGQVIRSWSRKVRWTAGEALSIHLRFVWLGVLSTSQGSLLLFLLNSVDVS